MHIDGVWFNDEQGRTLILRGANLGDSTKAPYRPNGATYVREGFYYRNVSFVGWNDKDLSVLGQQTDPDDVHSKGRALDARKVAGKALNMHFDLAPRTFEFRHDPGATAPTEIFVPDYEYPEGYKVKLSDGTLQIDHDALTLTVHHTLDRETHTIRICPQV